MRVQARRINTETPDGDAVCAIVTLVLTPAEEAALMGSFDPQSATSPPAAECRAIARPIAEAIAALDAP